MELFPPLKLPSKFLVKTVNMPTETVAESPAMSWKHKLAQAKQNTIHSIEGVDMKAAARHAVVGLDDSIKLYLDSPNIANCYDNINAMTEAKNPTEALAGEKDPAVWSQKMEANKEFDVRRIVAAVRSAFDEAMAYIIGLPVEKQEYPVDIFTLWRSAGTRGI